MEPVQGGTKGATITEVAEQPIMEEPILDEVEPSQKRLEDLLAEDIAKLTPEEVIATLEAVKAELARVSARLAANNALLDQAGSRWQFSADLPTLDEENAKLNDTHRKLFQIESQLYDRRQAEFGGFDKVADRFMRRDLPMAQAKSEQSREVLDVPKKQPDAIESNVPVEPKGFEEIQGEMKEYNVDQTMEMIRAILDQVEGKVDGLNEQIIAAEKEAASYEKQLQDAYEMLRQSRDEYKKMLEPDLKPEGMDNMPLLEVAEKAQKKALEIARKLPIVAADISSAEELIRDFQARFFETRTNLGNSRQKLAEYLRIKNETEQDIKN